MRPTRDSEACPRGRNAECEQLGQLISGARDGTSGVLVVRGEAGVGKTALLDYLLTHSSGCRIAFTTKLVRQTIDDMNGILDHVPLATRVAWVRDLFERIDVDSRDETAVAVWRAATDEGVNRSDSVYEWLRR